MRRWRNTSEHTDEPADYMLDARTGAIIWSHASCGCDNGRGVAGDVYAGSAGAEAWSSAVAGLSNTSGGQASSRKPGSTNFLVWWDTDTVRELLDSNHVDKYGTGGDTRLLTADGTTSNNGTKSTPALSGDIFGDWREEVVLRTTNNAALRIYIPTTVATNRIYTLLHDPQYRVAIAWQNTAYNQPPHPGFFIGAGMANPPTPNIVLVGGGSNPPPPPPPPPPQGVIQAETASIGGGTIVETTNGGFNGSGYINSSATGGFAQLSNVDGEGGGSKTLRIRFALGATTARTGQLVVNGTTTTLTFQPTGAWTTWQNLNVNVNLSNGTGNTIRFQTNGQDLANIDEIEIL